MSHMDTWSLQLRELTLPHGEEVPSLGLGTWRMGEDALKRKSETDALRLALDIGYRVIDTAEMYGEGGAESVLGDAIAAALRGSLAREQLFIVSKVLPQHAGVENMIAACERSLRRLRLDCLDLYLLHWRGRVPLKETVDAFEVLQQRGWIRHWGVSNFDLLDMRELMAVPGGAACSVNQVHYSLAARGIEFDLLPWQRLRQMPVMAYSPIDQGALVDHPLLYELAERHGATPAQIALSWVLAQPGVMAIPKAAQALHLRHNWQATKVVLDASDLARLDRLFPAPARKQLLSVR